jgi:L-asparaginase II
VPGPVPLVTVIRSGVEEAVHLGSVAVVDADGGIVAAAGDPDLVAFTRSCSKPFQAAASLSLIGDEEDLTGAEIAVMCGSHSGEEQHLRAVGSLLRRAGLGVDALRCPPAVPLGPAAALKVTDRRAEYHNCSGKHAGMLLACVRSGLDTTTYPEADHPVQQTVLDVLSRATAMPPLALGVDGCGVPVHAYPLANLARMFVALADPARLGPFEASGRRAVEAMLAEPAMVAGSGTVDTDVMQAARGLVVKGGAEGLMCAAAIDAGLGIAVKVADGAGRATGPALVRVLGLLGLLEGGPGEALAERARPQVKGGGVPVGELVATFDLKHHR